MFDTHLFYLQTDTGRHEVASFELDGLGFGEHFALTLRIKGNTLFDDIHAPMQFFFDDYCIHGHIEQVKCDGIWQQLLLRPACHQALADIHSRVFSLMSLEDMLKNLLESCGLVTGLDFELKLKKNNTLLWAHQDNESGIVFLNRLLAQYGLILTYQFTEHKTLLLICDDLTALPETAPRTIVQRSPSGMNAPEPQTDFELSMEPVSRYWQSGGYAPQEVKNHLDSAYSQHQWAKGSQQVLGHLDPLAAHIATLCEDECAITAAITLQDANIHLGQLIYLQPINAEQQNWRVRHICIQGFQSEAQGAESVNTQDPLHRARLSVRVDMAQALCGLLHPLNHIPLKRELVLGRIEFAEGRHDGMDDDGHYRVRLIQDSQTAGKAQASMPLRNALYYAGHQYGFAHPYPDGCVVLLAFENGHADKLVILGALPTQLQPSVINQEKEHQSTIQSPDGSHLSFIHHPTQKHSAAQLVATENKAALHILEQGDEASVTLEHHQGDINIEAKEGLSMDCGTELGFYATSDQHIWMGGAFQLDAKEKGISLQAENNLSIHSKHATMIDCHTLNWQVGQEMIANIAEGLMFKSGGNICLKTPQGQLILSSDGPIQIRIKKRLNISCPQAEINIAEGEVSFNANNQMILNAPRIHGLGQAGA